MRDKIAPYQTVTLERLAFAVNTAISRELIDDLASPLQGQWIEDHLCHQLIYQLRVGIAAQHLDQAVVKYPLNWREAAKQALYHWCSYAGGGHWPWFGEDFGPKRWPVKEKVVTIDVKALYPKIAIPDQQHTVQVIRREEVRPWTHFNSKNTTP